MIFTSRRIKIAGWSTTVFPVPERCKHSSRPGGSCGNGVEPVLDPLPECPPWRGNRVTGEFQSLHRPERDQLGRFCDGLIRQQLLRAMFSLLTLLCAAPTRLEVHGNLQFLNGCGETEIGLTCVTPVPKVTVARTQCATLPGLCDRQRFRLSARR